MSKWIWKVGSKKINPTPKAPEVLRRPGIWSIVVELKEGRLIRRRVSFREKGSRFWANVQGKSFFGEVQEPSDEFSGELEEGEENLVAQFPGKVRKCLVKENQKVNEGDPLVLLEAMKMEFKVSAPFAGRVVALRVKSGDSISPGDQLIEMERLDG